MAKSGKSQPDSGLLVSASELAEVIGIDLATADNWLRRGIITRARVGGRQLRSRLFSSEEVYRAALINELVKLGIPPSIGSEAVNALSREWKKQETPGVQKVYAIMSPSNENWTAVLYWQKEPGGSLYRFAKSTPTKSSEKIDLPTQAFVGLPISDVLDRINNKLSGLLG